MLEDLHLMRGIRYFSLYKVQKGFAGFIFGATGAIRTNAETRVAAKSAARQRASPRFSAFVLNRASRAKKKASIYSSILC